MVKMVKWFILLLCLTLSAANAANAAQRGNMPAEECNPQSVNQAHNPENILCSLICNLFNSACEMNQANSNLSLDSKSYIRLFIHLKYNGAYPPASGPDINSSPGRTSTESERKEYYIYALRKIIV